MGILWISPVQLVEFCIKNAVDVVLVGSLVWGVPGHIQSALVDAMLSEWEDVFTSRWHVGSRC